MEKYNLNDSNINHSSVGNEGSDSHFFKEEKQVKGRRSNTSDEHKKALIGK